MPPNKKTSATPYAVDPVDTAFEGGFSVPPIDDAEYYNLPVDSTEFVDGTSFTPSVHDMPPHEPVSTVASVRSSSSSPLAVTASSVKNTVQMSPSNVGQSPVYTSKIIGMGQKTEQSTVQNVAQKPVQRTAQDRAHEALIKRVPPHSVEAEQAVIGGIFARSAIMHTIVDMLRSEDFYMPAHQILFTAFGELYRMSAPIDLVSVAEYLRSRHQLEAVGGVVYLGELGQAVVTGANAEYYATLVLDRALQRNLINACSHIIGSSYDTGQDVHALLDESEQAVFSISQRTTGRDFSSTKELVDKVFTNLTNLADAKELVTGVTTGYTRIDRMTAGLQPSDLIIVAARPSMGKTAFAMCMALNAAVQQGISVAVYSLEMSKEQLMQRMLAVYAKVDVSLLRRPSMLNDEDWSRLFMAADAIGKAPIYIDDTPALSTLELRSRTRRLKSERDVGLVVVDYLQLMRAGRRIDSRELEISEISRSLKALAKDLNVPVVALSQLNRKVEERSDKRPMLSDLRESGAIEQDADVIMFIYRDDVYKFIKPSERPPQGIAEVIIGKQRNGPVGTAELMYVSRYTSFEELAPDWRVEPSEAS